jgi:hypothetical protein
MKTPTRGERNANPGNLDRNATKWQGMSPDQSGDPRFVVFTDPVWGIRALAKTLLTYYRKHGLDTPRRIIDRWAPPTENDTAAYVVHVAKLLGVGPDDRIRVPDPQTLRTLTKAIIVHENGGCIYDDATITNGIERALS